MSINYFCSGFSNENAFWPELARRLKEDLTGTERIVYIPGSNVQEEIEEAVNQYIPDFTEQFRKIGIAFNTTNCITLDTDVEEAKELVKNSNMVMLLGGNPFLQQELFTSKGLTLNLRNYNGVIMGFSAGAMSMSKYIIITPCSEEYPDFDIRPGLNLSGISIYPHNNFEGDIFPDKVAAGGDVTVSNDLLKVAKEYGTFYCLQDYERSDNLFDVSLIRTCGDSIQFFTENNGKAWKATETGFQIVERSIYYGESKNR